MSNVANEYLESLFQGIDIILDKKLEDVAYDTTVICTITDDSDAKNGSYKVTDGTISYVAYADTDKYLVGDQVRVTVPMGDFTQKKFISGKYVTDNDSNPITYVSPADTVMNISGNLALGIKGGIVANGTDRERVLWNKTLDASFISMQDSDIYNTIILKADFRTMLSNYDLIAGNYGLRLDFLVRPTIKSSVRLRRSAELDSKEMFGNPYSFSIYSPQAKVFKINTIGIIEAIELTLYQKGNFKDRTTGIITPFAENDDIFVDNIVLGLGCDLENVEDNKLQIYTESDLQYVYGNPTIDTNLKTMGLLWLNKDDNNQYVGFSDGVYDYAYDELDYIEKSKTENRLIAQQGREKMPPDKASLNLGANIEEAAPSIRKAVEVVTRDLVQTLRQFKQAVSSVERYSNNLDQLLGSQGDKYLITFTDQIENYLDSEEDCGLIQQYAQVLEYAYDRWKENSPTWDAKWEVKRGAQIHGEFKKIRDAVSWLLSTGSGKGFEGINSTYSGFKSIYDTYKIRIDRVMAMMDGHLGIVKDNNEVDYGQYKKYFPSGVLAATTPTDYTTMQGYKNKAKTSFKVYKAPDMTSYDNKYCIYWYRYEKDYKAPDTEQILGDGWRRLVNEDFYEALTGDNAPTESTYEKNVYYTYDKTNREFTIASGNFNASTTYYRFPSTKCFTVGDADRINIGLSGIYFYDDNSELQFRYRKTETYNANRKYYNKTTVNEKDTYTLVKNPKKADIQAGKYYARVCVNADGKWLHKPKVTNGKGLVKRFMQNDLEQEKYMAVLFYNHNMYKSNELVFDNSEVVPDKTTLDKGDILIFEHKENSCDDFQSYAITNYLMDGSDETRIRQIRCHYDGLMAKDNAFVSGHIYWYVPNQSTMLAVNVSDLTLNRGFAIDETRSDFSYAEVDFEKSNREYEANTYYTYNSSTKKYSVSESATAPSGKLYEKIYTTYCFYKKIEAKKLPDNKITTETREWDKWDYTNGTNIDNRDFWYKIRPIYEDTAQNNAISVKFVKNSESDEVSGEQLFTFGIKGTSGTKYTLAITNSTDQIASNGVRGLNLRAQLKDFDNNPLETSNLKSALKVNWIGYKTTDATEDKVTDPCLNLQTGNSEYLFNTAKGCYGIFKASASIELTGTTLSGLANVPTEESTSEDDTTPTGRTRQVDLEVVHAVPFCGHCSTATNILHADDFYIQGPSRIIYNGLGTLDNNSIFNTPYRLFAKKDCTVIGTNYKQGSVIKNVEWRIVYYKVKNGVLTALDKDNGYTQEEIEFYDMYMPKMAGNSLTPATMYLTGLDCYPVVEARTRKTTSDNYIYLWRQPIVILQNKYASSMLNDWDGSLTINKENGTILSSMVGAGRKSANNTFEGVLMGDVALGSGSNIGFENGKNIGLANQTGIGLYGFQDGKQSFGFNIDGTAFLGKSGRGRIIFNGNSGTIASANWFTGEFNEQHKDYDATSNPYPNGGKIGQDGSISKHSNAGMCIDLDAGHIDAYNFKLTSKDIYLNSNPDDPNIPGSTNTRDEYSNYYMRIGDQLKTGYIGLTRDGELEIRVNSLHITGSLGSKNLLQQTAPALASTVKYWNQYTKTTEAVLNADGTVKTEATTTTTWKKESHDSNSTFHYQWKLTKWTNPDASASGVISWDYNSTTEKSEAYNYAKGDKVKAYGNLWTADKAIAQHALPPGDEDSDWSPAIEVVTSGDKEKVIHVNGNNKQIYQTMSLRDKKKYTLSGYARSTVANKKFGLIVGSSNQYEIIYSNLDEDNLHYDPMPREWTFEDTEWHYFRCTFLTPGDTPSTYNTRRLGFTCEAPFEIWHTKLEEGEIASAWSPAPEDVEDNATVTMNKYDQNLAQDAVFEKLFKDPKTGLMADGISLVPADKSVTGIPELYINASYIAAGILRSKNWDGKIKAKYNSTTKEYDYTIHTHPTVGMYIDLNQGKVWAAKFELNAWDANGEGLYLNSHPPTSTANGHNYYLRLGNTTDYISFSQAGLLDIKASTFNLTAGASGSQIKINSAAKTYPLQIGSKFKVKWDGSLEATNADLSGKITASSGQIGNWNITTAGNLQSSNGSVTLNGNTGAITGSAISGGTLSIGDNFNVTNAGVLTATGATLTDLLIKEDLEVKGSIHSTGNADFDGTANFDGNTTVGGTLKITGNTTISGTSNLTVGGNTTITGKTTISGNTSITGTSTLTVGGATTITGKTTIKGNTEITGTSTLTVGGATTINGNTVIKGTLTLDPDNFYIGTAQAYGAKAQTIRVDVPFEKGYDVTIHNGIITSISEPKDSLLTMWWKKLTGKEPDLGTTDVESFGKLAWLDKVVISNATFKLGSGTAKKITPTVSGDTATFTVDIPGQKYSGGNGTTSGHWVSVYANMDPPDGFTISDSWTSHYVGRVWADGEKYEVDGGTTDDREATIKITVKAEADD